MRLLNFFKTKKRKETEDAERQDRLRESYTPKEWNETKTLVYHIFGKDASEDADIVATYIDTYKIAIDAHADSKIDQAIEILKTRKVSKKAIEEVEALKSTTSEAN